MADNKPDWYVRLKEAMLTDKIQAITIFIAYYFYLMREPTLYEFEELWPGKRQHYYATRGKFESQIKPFME